MEKNKIAPKVLMVGPGRDVMGGISAVVNSYYKLGLDTKIDLHYISSMEDGTKLKKLMVALGSYIEFLRSLKDYDIVHVHMAAQVSYTRKSIFIKRAKQAGKKIILHQHSADFDEFFFKQSDEKKRKQIKNVFAMADIVLVLSEEWAKFFGDNVCDQKKIVILHNGVIIPEYHKENYSDNNVLFLGRLGERKGSYDLLKAIPNILKEVPDTHFYFGGDGDVEQSQRIINENGLQDQVTLLGWVRNEEKEKYLKKCSTFILPSYHEGMPMAVLEAMSYGLATVSTKVGGIPRIIDDKNNGFLITPGDISEITASLLLLLQDVQLKEKIALAGRNVIENKFSAQAVVNKLVEVYQSI